MFRKQIIFLFLLLVICSTVLATSTVDNNVPLHLIVPPECATQNSVTLLWDKPIDYSHVTGYCIFEGNKQIAETDKTNYRVSGLTPGKSYVFYIKAKYVDGRLSDAGNKINIKTKVAGKVYNIIDFGAKGDGTTKNTKAIQKAIDACTPGGIVYIPEGTFLSGALFLKSDMTLYIDKGGVLKGSTDDKDYLPMIPNRFEGWELTTYASLLNAGKMDKKGGYTVNHLTIEGEGTISGGGRTLAGNMTSSKGLRGRGRLILLMNCQDVNIQGLTIEDSPCWTIHYIYSKNIVLHDLTIRSSVTNGDGIDPDSSTDSYIFGCSFATGDDCIAIKSGKNPEGYYIAKPTENVFISDCNFISGHGISIGSEMSGGVRNVHVRDCIAGNLKYGFQIKATKDRGGFVENISVKDCALRKITVFSSVGYNNDGEPAPVMPFFKNLVFTNIDMRAAEEHNAIVVQGFPGESHYTQDVTFENITLPDNGVVALDECKNVIFKNVLTASNKKPVYHIQNCLNTIY